MRRPLILVLLLAFALTTMGQESCSSTTTEEKTIAQGEEPAEKPTAAGPAAKFSTKCDYLLSGDIDSPNYFVGSADIRNTGTGDVRVKVVASWEQLGDEPIRQTKTVTVREGKRRRVRFKVQETGNQISAHQSADSECRVKGRVLK